VRATQIGIVDLDDSLQALISRVATDAIAGCKLHCGSKLTELECPSNLDVLIYNLGNGLDQIETWRKNTPTTKLILLVDTAQAETWTRIDSLSPSAVLSIPFAYQELRAALT